MKNISMFLFILMILISCSNNKNAAIHDPITEHIDTTVNPGSDFFNYANGTWFKANPIPASESYNGIFLTVGDSVNNILRIVCENSARDKQAEKGSSRQKIGSFYRTGMDTAAIEKAGIKPLEQEFNKIKQIKDVAGLLKSIAYLNTIGVRPAFSFFVSQDEKYSDIIACHLYQGGLGLPDRDYYFNKDERTKKIRDEYVKHVSKMFNLVGENADIAAKHSKSVLALESKLAKASRKLEDLREEDKNYNKVSVAELNKLTPEIEWNSFFKDLGLNQVDSAIVGQPEFLQQLSKEIKATSIDDWKTYLCWNLINTYASYLNVEIDKQNFNFYGTILSGTTEQQPRWKRIVEQTEYSLREIVSQEYISYLPKNAKEKLLEIGNNIKEVYAERIKNLDWMSEPTRIKALNKLEKVNMKFGYPDKWRDYSGLIIEDDSYILNIMRCNQFNYNHQIQKFGKPADRSEWSMTAETYNASYSPSNNEICIPACNIIVPGFFDSEPDDAVLYAIIGGSTIGHELTHGFDDQGRKYDASGNLNNWWTKEDSTKFSQRAQLIVDQFDNYVVMDSLHIRGQATLGENIADLGGLKMGFEAFKKTEQYKSGKKINGLSPTQRYFLAYAYGWMLNMRKEYIVRQIMTDVHSPVQYRVNGPVVNMTEFYKAFNIKSTDKLYRDEKNRIKIW